MPAIEFLKNFNTACDNDARNIEAMEFPMKQYLKGPSGAVVELCLLLVMFVNICHKGALQSHPRVVSFVL